MSSRGNSVGAPCPVFGAGIEPIKRDHLQSEFPTAYSTKSTDAFFLYTLSGSLLMPSRRVRSQCCGWSGARESIETNFDVVGSENRSQVLLLKKSRRRCGQSESARSSPTAQTTRRSRRLWVKVQKIRETENRAGPRPEGALDEKFTEASFPRFPCWMKLTRFHLLFPSLPPSAHNLV